jgi:hypothetical protein
MSGEGASASEAHRGWRAAELKEVVPARGPVMHETHRVHHVHYGSSLDPEPQILNARQANAAG